MTNHNKDKYVISLYDYTGEALKPWAMAGYQCLAYDIQHDGTAYVLVGSYYYYNKSSSIVVVFVKYHLMFSVDNDSTVAFSLLFLNSYETSHHLYNLNEEFFLDVKSTLYEISGFVQDLNKTLNA